MAEEITTFSDFYGHKYSPFGWLQSMAEDTIALADLWDEYESDFFEEELEECRNENPEMSLLEVYSEISNRIHGDDGTILHTYIYDSGHTIQMIERFRMLILQSFENLGVFPSLLNAISIISAVIEEAKKAEDNFYYYQYYPVCLTREDAQKWFGESAAKRFDERQELTADDYEMSFTYITELLELIEKRQYSEKLRESAYIIKGYCKLTSDPEAYAEIEKRPEDATLLRFMKKYCEKRTNTLFRSRRKSLNDAHNRKVITLPKHAEPWKSGQSKRYEVSDLIKKWTEYREILPNLPKLK